jgi:hypothetical protein
VDVVMEIEMMQLRINSVPAVTYGRESFPIRVSFANATGPEVRLLRHFEPIPVFFSFTLTRPDGTPIPIAGAGKIDFEEGKVDCILIEPGESFDVELDLAPWLTAATLTPGAYRLSATYHNQYGDDCFQGHLTSEPIEIQI